MQEKIKAISATVFQSVKNALETLCKYLKSETELTQQQIQQSKAIQSEQLFRARCTANLLSIQDELFAAMSGKHYPFLAPIYITSDIIPMLYRSTPKGVIYRFKLQATGTPAAFILQQIKSKINNDIYTMQQQELSIRSYTDALMLYPHIIAGLYIINIRQNGIYFEISVASHYF